MYLHINKLLIHGILRSVMAEKSKGNFSETEIEVLVDEVEARKSILFGGHSSGITNKRKGTEWQHVVTSVNSVSSTERTVAEVKKKWSDLKVEAKKRVTCHRQIVSATGGGRGKPEPTPLDSRIASILGTASGVESCQRRKETPIWQSPQRRPSWKRWLTRRFRPQRVLSAYMKPGCPQYNYIPRPWHTQKWSDPDRQSPTITKGHHRCHK
ncbi:t-SNARE domain-containing protein 1-like [Amphiprion ocellaris]|nr:t-SNARE domain-containing protein 1-like [Amphiprion ocellaris]